ncbi:MAG TPA: SufD family Fe-S cluster assembly protein, partial [Longimicrobiaceae bacterium]
MTDTTTAPAQVPTGVFTRDQAQILAARKVEPDWLAEARLAAHDAFAAAPMPSRGEEDWRYSWQKLGKVVDFEAYAFPEERGPVATREQLPAALTALLGEDAAEGEARLAQVDASVVWRDVPEALVAQGVVVTSLEAAVREHPALVQRYLGTGVTPGIGKFAALNAAFWTGGLFVYVPRNVKVELPLRAYRWIGDAGTAVFGRTLVIAEAGAEVAVVDELASGDFGRTALHAGAAEIFADEGATVIYTSVQRFGRGVVHLQTDRLAAGRDA